MYSESLRESKYESVDSLRLPTSGPLLILSNHPFSLRTFLEMFVVKEGIRQDLIVMVFSPFEKPLNALHMETIGVTPLTRISHSINEANSPMKVWRAVLDSAAQKKESPFTAFDKAVSALNNNKAVWIAPAGARDEHNSRAWSSFVPRILYEVSSKSLQIGMVHVPDNPFERMTAFDLFYGKKWLDKFEQNAGQSFTYLDAAQALRKRYWNSIG